MSLEEKFAKIKTPNLESQKQTALVLTSIEEVLSDQNTKFTPTAYFAALLALLNKTNTTEDQTSNNEILSSTIYLLDVVAPHVPHAVLRSLYSKITAIVTPVLSRSDHEAPLIRNSLGCLESLLLAQDSAAWALPAGQAGPRQAMTAILSLSIDGRPKVRKRAQEALAKILEYPPPGPAIDHPAAELCAASAMNNLRTVVEHANQVKRRRHDDDNSDPDLIHALQLVKSIATAGRGWPSKTMESLCELLLSISRSRNEFLVMNAFEVFEVIFEGLSDEISSPKLERLLDAIVGLKPMQTDLQLVPSWIAVVSRGFGILGQIEPQETFAKLPELIDLVTSYLTSPSHNVRVSASECIISFYASCVPKTVILEPSVYDEKILQRLASQANDLLTVKYQLAWMEVFRTVSAIFDAVKWRGDPYMLPLVKAMGDLRGNEGFHGKMEADEVLGTAIRNLGPQAVLTALPLNLTQPGAHEPGRVWLLPLLRDHVSNTTLAHFKTELVPLSETMYERVLSHGDQRTMESKIFETVIQQVWASLPGYCDLPVDLRSVVDTSFAEQISNLLYKQAELRVDLCRGLQNLVESNQAILASDLSDEVLQLERRITREEATQNIQHLQQFAGNLLAVLFNVYSQTLPQSRAFILQCINAYLSITPEKDLVETFDRVSKMFEAATVEQKQKQKQSQPKASLPPTSHTLLDLIVALSVHLPRSSFARLFSLASTILTSEQISISDPQLVKKAYKLIPRLSASPAGSAALFSQNQELQALILGTVNNTPVPARRDRLLAIGTIVSFLPLSELHFIPSILSEIVLACKDSNEKARTAGFDLLLIVAKKISDPTNPSGTVIRNRFVQHMPDDAPDAPASIEEVFTMVSAGLAGVAPHMVAASITALARLLFEFHTQLQKHARSEIIETVDMFLQSNNREIVRAVLGFVKVVVVLPTESGVEELALEARMRAVMPGLMLWSNENKGRLRAKVKGIIDRCIRRFGAVKVQDWAQNDKERKIVTNIRKKRDRAKRKPGASVDDDDEHSSTNEKEDKSFDNEFDEAVYGSSDDDSEIEGSDADVDDQSMTGVSFRSKSAQKPGKRSRGKRGEQFIRENSDEEPLDLLNPRSQSAIASRKTVRFDSHSKSSGHRRKAKVNEDGKLVFGEPVAQSNGDDLADGDGNMNHGAVNAYVVALSGPDAVRRGQKGRLKVKSGKQKTPKDEMDLGADDAKAIGRQLETRTRANGVSPGRHPQQTRRALGVAKSSQASAMKHRHGGRVGKKVKFQAGKKHGGYGRRR